VVSLVGIIASLYFTFIQIFVIGAFCIYCSASAIIALLIFILATLIEPVRSEGLHKPLIQSYFAMPPKI
jgi:uncharacterized membrane protein